ncbi:Uncharacterised protein r2_g4306 [Pycnogonum litorale]
MAILRFILSVTSEVLVIILTVLVLTVESNNECEDDDSIWPCNCEFDAWGVNNIHCKHDNWTAIKEALQKYSSAYFPNLVEIVGVMFQTRKRPAVELPFSKWFILKSAIECYKTYCNLIV